MKAKLLLRIAAACLLFHLLGHTMGHFTWKDTPDVKKQQVISQMDENSFEFMGAVKSLGQNYEGLSLNLIFVLIMMTWIVWVISGISDNQPKLATKLLIPIFVCLLAFAIADYIYWFPMVAITCLAAAILILIAIIQIGKTRAKI